MLLTDFCNRLATCAPDESLDSRGGAHACAQSPRPMERMPQQTTQVVMRLTTHPELRSNTSHAPADPAGTNATRSCRALDRKSGPQVALPVPRRYLPRTGRACRPLTPPSRRAWCRSTSPAAETGFPTTSFKSGGSVRPGAPSLDECLLDPCACAQWPRTQTRHRSRDFAASVRLPALLRPLAPEGGGLDPAASGAFFTPGRSWPRAARRLLQPKRSASTTAGLRNPAPNRAARLSPSSPFRAGPRAENGATRANGRLSITREPRIHASGALSRGGDAFRRCHPGLSLRDCSRRELHPDPIPLGHLLSRRPATVRWESPPCVPNGPASRRRLFRQLALGDRLRGVTEEGRLPHPFAKRRCVPLHPRCLPSKDPPFGRCPFPQLVTNLWSRARASSISAPSDTRTVRRWCGDSASAPGWIDHPRVGRPSSRRK